MSYPGVRGGGSRQWDRITEAGLTCNAEMCPRQVRHFYPLDETGRSLIRQAMVQLQPSARTFLQVLKLARTIADLAGEDRILPNHLAEGLEQEGILRPKRGTNFDLRGCSQPRRSNKERWYDPVPGRFMQAGPIVPDSGKPQGLDRYANGLNNLLKYNDPDGHFP